jgi:hypothetical protein
LKNSGHSSYQTGEDILIGAAIWVTHFVFFGEREGTVKYEDCREVITLQPDTLQAFFKSFTCSYRKAKGGTIMQGLCVHADSDSTLFSSSHACATAYVYA